MCMSVSGGGLSFTLRHQLSSAKFSSVQLSSVQFTLLQWPVQISSVQFSSAQFSSVQFNSVKFSSFQFSSSVRFSSVQFSSVLFSSLYFSSVQFSSVQFISVQFSSGNAHHDISQAREQGQVQAAAWPCCLGARAWGFRPGGEERSATNRPRFPPVWSAFRVRGRPTSPIGRSSGFAGGFFHFIISSAVSVRAC